MPTKKRINIVVDDSLFDELERLKEFKQAPSLSSLVLELTRQALELQEDIYFSNLVDERKKESGISHEDLWK